MPTAPRGAHRPSLARYVTLTGTEGEATASGCRSCRRSSPRVEERRMDLELRGRTAVVTGCSVGIGREIVRVLAAEGVLALVIARRGDLLKILQDEIDVAGWVLPHALA